jgi:hypothetical protein
VLNAQLQSLISLSEYVRRSGDAEAEAEAFVAGLSETTRSLLGRFAPAAGRGTRSTAAPRRLPITRTT